MLKQARIDDPDLKYIAETKSQAHLLALSTRSGISEALSDMLVRRGDREVARSVANNQKARLSENAFTTLVKRAEHDGVLAEKVGLRTDIPPRLFRQLLMQASEVVQKRLLAQAKPETQAEIRRVLAKVTDEVAAKAAPRNYTAALAAVRALHKERKLSEADIAEYAKSGKYEETIAALATVSAVPVEVVDRLMNGERADPVLILARAAGFGWPTVRDDHQCAARRQAVAPDLDAARENFERLTAATAQRVVRFWQVRQGTGELDSTVACPENKIRRRRGLRAWPWPRSACRKNPARACASRRRAPPSRRNPASAARAPAHRPRNRRCRWRSAIRRRLAECAPAA